MKPIKRWLGIFFAATIAVFLAFTAMSVPASAETGACGDNVVWDLTDGTLTISGSGAMTEYTATKMPWYASRASITAVVVEDGVTSISPYAFQSYTALTKTDA